MVLVVGLLMLLTSIVTASESRFFRVIGPVPTTITGVTADGIVTWTNAATNATLTVQTASVLHGESNWVDWVQVPVSNAVTVHRIFDPTPPSGMAFIPAGRFTMGDTLNDGQANELPLHDVYVNAFHIDRTVVTNDKMVEVMQWAYEQGKITVSSNDWVRNLEGDHQELLALWEDPCRITWNRSDFGMKPAKGSGYPCVNVTWYGALAFCNYRSEMEELTPCYNLTNWTCSWSANGYRVPTEAEWEKAARGGISAKRFPWGNTIDHGRANYQANGSAYTYDVSPYTNRTYHPDYDEVGAPFTNPAGDFPPNAYGLYDMAGNTWEWCWDRYGAYSSEAQTDPKGPSTPAYYYRIRRGGGYTADASECRTAERFYDSPEGFYSHVGFRCVRDADSP